MSFGGKKGAPEPMWRQFLFSGISGMVASAATHPLDLIKVRMQVESGKGLGIVGTGVNVFKAHGIMGLYDGLSASLLRQATYTTARIGFYLQIKEYLGTLSKDRKGPPPLWEKVFSGMTAGALGAFVGSPADLVLVRMQADGKLPESQRRNYKHAFDGLSRIVREEGLMTCWKGSGPNIMRAMLMTTGQVASYDQAKQMLLETAYFKDDIITHFTASTIASFIATVICNPLDVVKTRIMNVKKGEGIQYKNSLDVFVRTTQSEGVLALWKGFWPFFMRLAPHTIITFVTYEQLAKIADKMSGR